MIARSVRGEVVTISEEGPDFDSLFAREYRTLVRTVYLIVHDRGRAEDVAQDAFARLLVHWGRVRHYDRPDAWVRKVAVRLALREQARERARHEVEAMPYLPPRETSDDGAVLDAVRSLPHKERAVVVLFYFVDLPMKEIAPILEIPASTGFVLLHRARKRLGLILEEEVNDEG